MHGEEAKQIIAEYLRNDRAEYAVLLNGEWGSGKTYFMTHSLQTIIEEADIGKNERRKYAYVSLYGVKSTEEISKEIVFYSFGRNNKGKCETANTIIETASGVITASLGSVNINLSKMQKALTKLNVRNWIICFDDLERCSMSIIEILGFINNLVEHNHCKVIILANENEIGASYINQRVEEKYRVILSGMKLDVDIDNTMNDTLSIEDLKQKTRKLFNQDLMYKSIREKLIGLTITFEPDMYETYDSIIKIEQGKFKTYLSSQKIVILNYFKEQNCKNLRTLNSVIGTLHKVNKKMEEYYNDLEFSDKIMGEFLRYIVHFTIFYREGKIESKHMLKEEIGTVYFGKYQIRGFRFLQKYCSTLDFSEESFTHVVSVLRSQYDQEKKIMGNQGKYYRNLDEWWKLEDNEVIHFSGLLKDEIAENKYSFYQYQSIISRLLYIKFRGFQIEKIIDEAVSIMKHNIDKAADIVEIETFGSGLIDAKLEKEYIEYLDKLKLTARSRNGSIKEKEIEKFFQLSNWAQKLLEFCKEHDQEFVMRSGFIDLINIEQLYDKMEKALVKDIYNVCEIFEFVYRASNIYEFYMADKDDIEKFNNKIQNLQTEEINKKGAIEYLKTQLKTILDKFNN